MTPLLKKEDVAHDLDSPEASLRHREILLGKPFLKKLYTEWYRSFIETLASCPSGDVLEIGSGGGFLKDLLPRAITSDVKPLPHCDRCFRAEELPFPPDSLSAIFMINTLHHLPDAAAFFEKAQAALKAEGIVFMIEPASTWLSRIIYTRLHHEPFDPSGTWTFPAAGPMSGANDALPWIIFRRDVDRFHEKFPHLGLVKFRHHTPFRYLLSGGFSYRSLLPGALFGAAAFLERLTAPLFPFTAMFNTIVVRKSDGIRR